MHKISEEELGVMKVLWKHGEQKPSEIQERLPGDVKNNVLRYYLKLLMERGYVERRLRGRAYYYRARSAKDATFGGIMRELAGAFYDGSSHAVLIHLIRSEKLSEEELLELHREARALETELAGGDGSEVQDGEVSEPKRGPRPGRGTTS